MPFPFHRFVYLQLTSLYDLLDLLLLQNVNPALQQLRNLRYLYSVTPSVLGIKHGPHVPREVQSKWKNIVELWTGSKTHTVLNCFSRPGVPKKDTNGLTRHMLRYSATVRETSGTAVSWIRLSYA